MAHDHGKAAVDGAGGAADKGGADATVGPAAPSISRWVRADAPKRAFLVVGPSAARTGPSRLGVCRALPSSANEMGSVADGGVIEEEEEGGGALAAPLEL